MLIPFFPKKAKNLNFFHKIHHTITGFSKDDEFGLKNGVKNDLPGNAPERFSCRKRLFLKNT
jgi:hypothetical protein